MFYMAILYILSMIFKCMFCIKALRNQNISFFMVYSIGNIMYLHDKYRYVYIIY